ncbi:MAG: hypothetical protein IKE20_03120 [Eggerthellaceae bacterium]|nr:hypothetical protein [Eggerthellaceae bacterium]
MTDNRAIELREKLDESGIEHFDYDKGGRTQTMWESPEDMRYFTYETAANPAKTARLIIEWFPTPEQAIAATLGSEREKALENLVVDMWHELNYTSVRAEDGYNICLEKMAAFDERLKNLGLMEED